MPRAQSGPLARNYQGNSPTIRQARIQRKLRVVSDKLLNHLRRLRAIADLPVSPASPPGSTGIMRQVLYTGWGEVTGDGDPWFGDLGRVQWKVRTISLLLATVLISNLQKPAYKRPPICLWDPLYIPRALLQSDMELLRLLRERDRLTVEWETVDAGLGEVI